MLPAPPTSGRPRTYDRTASRTRAWNPGGTSNVEGVGPSLPPNRASVILCYSRWVGRAEGLVVPMRLRCDMARAARTAPSAMTLMSALDPSIVRGNLVVSKSVHGQERLRTTRYVRVRPGKSKQTPPANGAEEGGSSGPGGEPIQTPADRTP